MLVDLAVAALVLSLPISLQSGPAAAVATTATESDVVSVLGSVDADTTPRARTVSRGATLTAASEPRTAIAEDVRPIVQYKLAAGDTLQGLANYYKISAEAIAFSNGITDPDLGKHAGRQIMIPPFEGALYHVKEGDTIEGLAARFKVDQRVIMAYNRLYFEPEHFAPGKLIFVPGAAVPGLVYAVANPAEDVRPPLVVARPEPAAQPQRTSRLPLPVNGRITQFFWGYHPGVDIAAPYGSPVKAVEFGTVVSTGWVPVGGLHVTIKHGNDFVSGYYHLGSVFVAPGQKVWPGQAIGTIGMTGVTTGPHVHWEITLAGGGRVNPLTY